MLYRILLVALVGLLIGTSPASAGNIYKVTSQDGEKTITYEVRFGGGRLMDQFTAFDPETKKFVVQLPKDKYLWVYFADPSLDNATNPLRQVDSSQTSFAGANGTRQGDTGGVAAGFIWELTGAADKIDIQRSI